jgi:UDP-GlcNAc:undecaprenyl-phosphate GlcNAc-1-phosphate transferase
VSDPNRGSPIPVSAAAILPFAWGVLATVLLTPLARWAAVRLGVLDAPGPRKIHRAPVPYLGGVAVVTGILVVWAVLAATGVHPAAVPGSTVPVLLGGMVALMLVGVVDDAVGLSPRIRFVVQGLATGLLLVATGSFEIVRVGGLLSPEMPAVISLLLGAIWVVSITNAANMLDGMDGLAAGVGAEAAAVLAYLGAVVFGHPDVALLLAVAAGAFAGFLVYNTAPARIFLGDAGSLPLGFLLGAGALTACTRDGVLHAVPMILVVGVPATDVILSVLRRGLAAVSVERLGRSRERYAFRVLHAPRFFQGDRGHLHHRLLEHLGSVPRTVGALYAVTAVLGALALWAATSPELAPMILVGSLFLGLTTVAPFLHSELRFLETGILLPLFHTRYIGQRVLHAAWDAAVIAAAFVTAGWIGSRWLPDSLSAAGRVALAAAVGLLTMSLLGLYRVHFRNAGAWSFWTAMAAVGSGAAAVMLVDTVLVGPPLSTASALLFFYLTLTGGVLPRAAYTFMADAYARRPKAGRTTVIDGVGRIEAAFLERALADPGLALRPVAFLHDGGDLTGRWLRGFPVLEADDLNLERTLRVHDVDVVVTVFDEVEPPRLARLRVACRSVGASLLVYRESLEELIPPGLEGSSRELPGDASPEVRHARSRMA